MVGMPLVACPSILLTVVVCWSVLCASAAAQTRCVSFSDSIDGVDKDPTVEKPLKSLDAQIENALSRSTGLADVPHTPVTKAAAPGRFWSWLKPPRCLDRWRKNHFGEASEGRRFWDGLPPSSLMVRVSPPD